MAGEAEFGDLGHCCLLSPWLPRITAQGLRRCSGLREEGTTLGTPRFVFCSQLRTVS